MGCAKQPDLSDLLATHESRSERAQANQAEAGDPVNMVTGAFTLAETDIVIPTQRLMLAMRRYYDSAAHIRAIGRHENEEPGPLGPGWTHSLNMRLEFEPDAATFVDDRHIRLNFKRTDTGYKPPPGSNSLRLVQLATGGWELRQGDGLRLEFAPDGRLLAVVRPGCSEDSRICLSYDIDQRLVRATGAHRWLQLEYHGGTSLLAEVRTHSGLRWRYAYDDDYRLASVLDPADRVREYQYRSQVVEVTLRERSEDREDPEPRVVSRTIAAMSAVLRRYEKGAKPGGAEVRNQYTSDGRVSKQIDAEGGVTRFEYNRFTRTTAETGPLGWTHVYAHDKHGNTVKTRTPEGRTKEWIFDDRANLIASIGPSGERTLYAELGNPSVLDAQVELGLRALGNRSDYVTISRSQVRQGYDDLGNRTFERDPLGRTWLFSEYSRFGRPGRVELPDGSEICWSYCERSGLPTRWEHSRREGAGVRERIVRQWERDALGNPTRMEEWAEDGGGTREPRRIAEWEYDAAGNDVVRKRTWLEGSGDTPLVAEEQIDYDALGRPVERRVLRRGPDGVLETLVCRYGYDPLGNPIWVQHPDGSAQCARFGLDGNVVKTFSLGVGYSGPLDQVQKSHWLLLERFRYDRCGRLVEHEGADGSVVRRVWDAGGNCTREVYPDGTELRFAYDRDGHEVWRETRRGLCVESTVDESGRLVHELASDGVERRLERDVVGRVVVETVSDADREWQRKLGYDLDDRVVESDGFGGQARLGFDLRGSLVERRTGDSYGERWSRDGLGRVLAHHAGRPTAERTLFRYRYGDDGRVVVVDALGNETLVQLDSAGLVTYRREANGDSIRSEWAAGQRVRRWSADGQVDQRWDYDALGRVERATEYAVSIQNEYDSAGRMVRSRQTAGSEAHDVRYCFDASDRLSSVRLDDQPYLALSYRRGSIDPVALELPGGTVELGYDERGRVVEERWPDGRRAEQAYQPGVGLTRRAFSARNGTTVFKQALAWDANGYLVSEERHTSLGVHHIRYETSLEGRLVEVAPDGAPPTRLRYDELGNLVSLAGPGGARTNLYDAANRLQEADGAPAVFDAAGNLTQRGVRHYEYDSAQRLRRVSGPDGVIAEYLWYPSGLLAARHDVDGTAHFFYEGPQRVLTTTPAARRWAWWRQDGSLLALSDDASDARRVVVDHVGSVLGLGDAVDVLRLAPYGDAPVDGDLTPGFAGKWWDARAGIYDSRFRWYDPNSGRFTQPDQLGTADGANVYLYGRSNPVTYTDPMGTKAVHNSRGTVSEFGLERIRNMVLEHRDAQGHLVGRSYYEGPGFMESKGHLVHYDLSGNVTGRTYERGPRFMESRSHLEHRNTGGNVSARSYLRGPGWLESSPHLVHRDTSGNVKGRSSIRGPGFMESRPHLEHHDSSGNVSGRSYLRSRGWW